MKNFTFALKAQAKKIKFESTSFKATLLALLDYTNKDLRCWPSQVRLAEETGYSVATIKRAIKKLKEQSIIQIHQRKYSGHKLRNTYTINTNEIFKLAGNPHQISPIRCHGDTLTIKVININKEEKLSTPQEPQQIQQLEQVEPENTQDHFRDATKMIKPCDVTNETWTKYVEFVQTKKPDFVLNKTLIDRMRIYFAREQLLMEEGLNYIMRHNLLIANENFKNFGTQKFSERKQGHRYVNDQYVNKGKAGDHISRLPPPKYLQPAAQVLASMQMHEQRLQEQIKHMRANKDQAIALARKSLKSSKINLRSTSN